MKGKIILINNSCGVYLMPLTILNALPLELNEAPNCTVKLSSTMTLSADTRPEFCGKSLTNKAVAPVLASLAEF